MDFAAGMEINGIAMGSGRECPTTLVNNGAVDIRGRTADKTRTGGWRASGFIIVGELAERMAFFAITVNMVEYLVTVMHESLPDAAAHVADWVGAAFVLTILGAFLADAYLGRFLTILIFTSIYAVGMVLLTLAASDDSFRPPPCTGKDCPRATTGQEAFMFVALALIALGTGGIKPCVSTLGADQFDEADKDEARKKHSFFDWFLFTINMGVLLGITLVAYVKETQGWGWGFGVPTAITIMSVMVFAVGAPLYRYQKPAGSALMRFVQVVVAACRNHMKGVKVGEGVELFEFNGLAESDIMGARKLSHTPQLRFFDKAAAKTENSNTNTTTNRWMVCTVTQVEEFKAFVQVLPIWLTNIVFGLNAVQMTTFFIAQAALTDRRLSPHFVMPPGSTPIFAALNVLLLVPVYEHLLVPLLRRHTGHSRGVTSLQRIGIGLFVCIPALASAALVERRRRSDAHGGARISVFWLLPQYFLVGFAEVFTLVGQLEFFYDEVADSTRSLSNAIFLSELGIGGWLSTAIVKIVGAATGGTEKGWLRNDLNQSKLDYFYWILCGINAVNFCVYVVVAKLYQGRK